RAFHFLAVQLKFYDIFRGEMQAAGHLWAYLHRVVPGQLRHRLRKLLQPAVVGELSVPDGGIAADVELDGRVSGRLPANVIVLCCHGFRLVSCALDPTIVQRLAPELFEVRAGVLLLPVSAYQVVATRIRLAGERGDEFDRAFGVVQRGNQRLNNTDRSVESAGITPGFEF